MTPEAQRIAIAEACGWTDCNRGEAIGYPRGLLPKASFLGFAAIPEYLTDLNAMHEAERVKEMAFDSNYAYWLAHAAVRDRGLSEDKLDVGEGYQIAITATAAQRAEAFLRTIGKWKDGK